MAYKVVINDVTVLCDTAEEVRSLAYPSSSHRTPETRLARSPRTRRTLHRGRSVRNGIMQKKLMEFVRVLRKAHPEGLRTNELAERLGVGPRIFGPMMTALSQHLARDGHKLGSIVKRETEMKNRKPISVYSITQKGMAVVKNW